ncbi:hypothetical protein GQ54DRAFT_313856 [Martensiomyces pterosporus]|nr:hypothetical protein GQ54DRAFT_313856 [Martensiomyces pterosporus]
MAAPVSWLPDESANKHKGSSHTHGHEHGRSTDSYGRICTGKLTTASTTIPGSHRLRCIFGDQVWPNVEHLDMAFMPLICYHGLVAHIRWTMPRLRTLRIGGFIPATALTDILSSQLPLAALEVSGGVWANSDAARRGSTSSWRSSVSTVTVQGGIAADNGDLAYSDDVDDSTISAAVGCYSAQPAKSTYVDALQPAPPPLTLLVVTADALRSPPVFSFAMAHLDTLAALHLLDCDYKIMDMLRLGRLEERHMHAVEYGSTQMVLHSQHRVPPGGVVVAAAAAAATTNTATMEHRPTRTTAVCWSSLKKLRIDRYYMAPRENTCLCIYADNMPCLEEFTVEHMEPCDSHHPTPSPADTSQMPRMRGCFARLARIKAPALDTGSLRTTAPALRSLSITGTGRALAHMMLPTTHDIQSLLSSGLPLAHLSVGGKLIAPKTP